MYLMFQMVYTLGKPLQDWLTLGVEWFKTAALEPVLGGLAKFPHDLLIEGIYGGVGTVAAFIPVIWIFFICMAIIEDSGYLSRSAYLMDAFMERLGLDGRSFVMSLMGLLFGRLVFIWYWALNPPPPDWLLTIAMSAAFQSQPPLVWSPAPTVSPFTRYMWASKSGWVATSGKSEIVNE